MGRTILASGLSFFFLAVPALAVDHASDGTRNKTTPIGAELTIAPLPQSAIGSKGTSAMLAAEPAGAHEPEPHPLGRPALLPALYVGSGLLQAFDAYSTMKALNLGGVEANPVMKNAVSNPLAFIGIKASVTAASILAAERMWKNHHRTAAIATMLASNGFMVWVAAHNASIVNGLQR